MKEVFSGIPNGVHSAFVWGGNGKIYLNEEYWMFDPERKIAISKQISEWGLPQGIDGALQWENGWTYFFKGGSTGGLMTELLVLILHLLLFLDLQENGGFGVQFKMYNMYKTV